jgi:uncharacterized protein
MYIGEPDFLRQDIGSKAITKFLEQFAFKNSRYVLCITEIKNEAAVNFFEKAGFILWKRVDKLFYMIITKKIIRLSISNQISLEKNFRNAFLKSDKLWVFGSRADLSKKGGDIDLYIETKAKTIDDAIFMRSKFLFELEKEIGEQKIDVVLNIINFPHLLPIHDVAKKNGVRII